MDARGEGVPMDHRPDADGVDAEDFVHVNRFGVSSRAAAASSPPPPTPLSSQSSSAAQAASRDPPKRSNTQQRLDRWEERLNKYPILHQLEEKTGIRALWIAIGAGVLFVGLVFFGLGAGVICIAIGFLYPVYMSFKTIESKEPEHLKQWLMYWVVYGIFSTLESYSDKGLSWVPLYYPLKLAFLLWCFLPRYNGAGQIFLMVVRPLLARNEAHIDEFHSSVHAATSATMNAAVHHVRERSRQMKRTSINWIQGMKAGIQGAPTPTAAQAAAAAAATTPRSVNTPSAGAAAKIPPAVEEEDGEKKMQ